MDPLAEAAKGVDSVGRDRVAEEVDLWPAPVALSDRQGHAKGPEAVEYQLGNGQVVDHVGGRELV